MRTGNRSRVRALGVAAMLALVAAAGVACGSSSSTNSGKPVHISLAAATQHPCQLVTLGQANAILDTGYPPGDTTGIVTSSDAQVLAGLSSSCVYGNLSSTVNVILNFGAEAEYFSVVDIKNSAPATVAGHAGACGAETGKYSTPGEFDFAAPVVAAPAASAVWLSVEGARSCAVDAKFAQAVFANL
jgi:hypothetical protein